ncbi:hypothetical protein BDN70DRAFT_995113 [Pholiota conissans]|uniref:Uncharacterized protein n=1 Tax=Pholiota conissans TaxID=109636 RepID=A0A9P5Z0H2_9AGAR|nr:hypothetical protein BDN70DRAFT_995113 [Pholiota conissans]
MSTVKLFPVPPPTNNDLTSLQRAQLLRKAKKIEQLLGATPHLVDTSYSQSPIRISLPQALSQRRSLHDRRSSLESSSSGSSSGSLSSSIRRSSSTTSYYSTRKLQRSPSKTNLNSIERWPRNSDAPILRLAMESLTLETIPASPPANRSSFTDSDTSSQDSSPLSSPATSFGDSPVSERSSSPRDSFTLENQFIIPTANSLRKQKMDRIRKKLGTDVPLHLVFPKDTPAEESPARDTTTTSTQHPNLDKACPPLPLVPSARPRKHTGPRISHARDSIVDAASIHRARRLAQTASNGPRPALGHKGSLTASITSSVSGRVQHRLSFIIESPDEHSAEKDFGLHVSRVTSETADGDVMSEWFGTDIRLWSAMKGLEGRNSTISIASIERNANLKRRSSSYRKPAPPVTSDCLNEIKNS